ncbi:MULTISPECIES: TIGR03086 family metal-binding protein [unclassified Streptomyces]|uniref:TIGR03086 family metal-binding protein n=1 Tax=unclassified Streptomyces TaxID=2593676 RepID=UPI0036529B7B
MSGIDGLQLVQQAHACLRAAVRGVPDDAWGSPTPCTEWTVRQVLNHARLDQQAYGAFITGEGRPESDPFQPADAFEADPVKELDEILDRVSAAWQTVPTDAGTVTTPLPVGPLPLWVGAGACALDAAVHAWDIAVATGQALPLPASLAQPLLAVAREPWTEQLRAFAFAPVVAAPDGDPGTEADQLLRHLGRDPGWAPTAP